MSVGFQQALERTFAPATAATIQVGKAILEGIADINHKLDALIELETVKLTATQRAALEKVLHDEKETT